MRAVILLAVAALGCGRFGFDPLSHGPGGDDGGFDPDAGPTPLACSPVAETCNGLDDDCNGIVDDGCPCAPLDKTVNESPSSYTMQVAWTGSTLFMLEGDAATIEMWSVADGVLGPHVPVYSGATGTVGTASFAWNGDKLGIAYEHDTKIVEFATYDPVAMLMSTPMTIDPTYAGAGPHVIWVEDHFVVAWQTMNDGLVTREISPAGTPLGPEQLIVASTAGGIGAVWVTKTGTIACLRHRSDPSADLVVATADGVQTLPLPIGGGLACDMLPIPGGYLAWYHTSQSDPVPLVFLDATGAVTSTATLPANPYIDVAIQRLPNGFWVLASTTPALYTHSTDELVLDAHGALVRGPTVLVDQLGAYLWSPPRTITTATRTQASWSINAGGAPSDYRIRETCGGS